MSVEQMRQVSSASETDEWPSGSLHETGCEGMVAFDDVSAALALHGMSAMLQKCSLVQN